MALHRVSSTSPIVIVKEGKPGDRGKPGKDGVTKVITQTITKIEPGEPGKAGLAPAHEVRNGEVRFKHPDGTWGDWVLMPVAPGGGPDSYNTYTLVAQATFRVNRTALTLGTNIFGVNFNGDVEIILPNGIDKRILILVKDESDNAGTFNITITTES